MKILIVKMTSMGDVLHVLPALSDLAQQADPNENISVDWMVEDGFVQIPAWHPLVERVIPVYTRRWRGIKWRYLKEFWAFVKDLRSDQYDYVIDAQGLIKSAVLSRFARVRKNGVRAGFSARSIKESPAALFYQCKIDVDRNQHAVDRLRQLLAEVVKYPLVNQQSAYSLTLPHTSVPDKTSDDKSIFIFHGTTWPTKHVPDALWREVIETIIDNGWSVKLCWGNSDEKRRADSLAAGLAQATVLPKSSLLELALQIENAAGAVAVDTGLGHLAAAMDIPCVSLYGATDPLLTGTYGKYQTHLQVEYPCAPCLLKHCTQLEEGQTDPPCYGTFSAQTIWHALVQQIRSRQSSLSV